MAPGRTIFRSVTNALAMILRVLNLLFWLITPSLCVAQVLRPYDRNPAYWQYKGKPVLLLGATDNDNLFQNDNVESHLDNLKSIGGNYIRNTMSDRDPGNERAFRQKGDGKYDLGQWNEAYWQRLDRLLKLATDRDIIVQIEIWDRFDHSRNEWLSDPFNPGNNVNYTYEAASLEPAYPLHPGQNKQPFFFTVPALNNNTILLSWQQAFVKKVLSVSLKYDNVLYCIDNETSGRDEWAVYWTDFLRQNSGGKKILITQMWDTWDVTADIHLRTLDHPERYDYIDISQNSHITGFLNWQRQQKVFEYIRNSPRPVNSTKIYGSDEGPWLDRGINEKHAVETFFRNIIGGFASSRFHRPPSGLGLSEPSIYSIQTIRRIEQYVHMWDIGPRPELLGGVEENEAYLAADEGNQYVVYFPGAGNVTVDLTRHQKPFTLRWISVGDSAWGKPMRVRGGSVLTLKTPVEHGCLAVLY